MTLTFRPFGAETPERVYTIDATRSTLEEQLNEPRTLNLTITSPAAPEVNLCDRVDYDGATYYVSSTPTVRKEREESFIAEVIAVEPLGLSRLAVMDLPEDYDPDTLHGIWQVGTTTAIDYTATAVEHLDLILARFNAKFPRQALTRGEVTADPEAIKHVQYNGLTLWEALQALAQTYGVEVYTRGNAVCLGSAGREEDAHPLAYGDGRGYLPGLERTQSRATPTPRRLYVVGSERNTRGGRLRMTPEVYYRANLKTGAVQQVAGPSGGLVSSAEIFYKTDPAGEILEEVSTNAQGVDLPPVEAIYNNTEIYPSKVWTVTAVEATGTRYKIRSGDNSIDISAALLDTEPLQVVFQTGDLAGRAFSATWSKRDTALTLDPIEEGGVMIPDSTLHPRRGDTYILTGIALPQEYAAEAREKLTLAAVEHLVSLQRTRYSYRGDLDPIYLDEHDAESLHAGGWVKITDEDFADNTGATYRVTRRRDYLDGRTPPEIEISTEPEVVSPRKIFRRLFGNDPATPEKDPETWARIAKLSLTLQSVARYVENAYNLINSEDKFTISANGQVTQKAKVCPAIDFSEEPDLIPCTPSGLVTRPINLALKSDLDALTLRVDALNTRVAILEGGGIGRLDDNPTPEEE